MNMETGEATRQPILSMPEVAARMLRAKDAITAPGYTPQIDNQRQQLCDHLACIRVSEDSRFVYYTPPPEVGDNRPSSERQQELTVEELYGYVLQAEALLIQPPQGWEL